MFHGSSNRGVLRRCVDSIAVRTSSNCDRLVEMSDLALELQGSAASYFGEGDAIDGGRWQHAALFWPATTIGGGTPNVQKNIIAERMLGLPKD